MRARSTNILDSTYITPVVQASSKTRAAMLMLAYNAPRKPQMCHNAVRTHRPTWTIGTRYCAAQVTSACSYKCVLSAIGYLLTGHEKVREGYGDTRVHKLQQESSGSTTMARATPACPLRPPHAPLAALSHCSPYPHAWLAQIVCLKRAPGRCGRPSAAASPRCRSSPGWTP